MKRRRRNTREKEEKEEKKRGRHDDNERETEDNRDRLSGMPDCVLIHILSFLKAEEAVRTCILSSTWQHLWKHLPTLTLKSSDFRTVEGFMNFVNGILPLRDFSTALNALDFELRDIVEPHVLESIVKYAASYNVNRLRLYVRCFSARHPSNRQFPSSLSSCHSLTSLDIGCQFSSGFPNSLNLPALTYLKLHSLAFHAGNDGRIDPFSTFNRLNTLILFQCVVWDVKPLCISSTTLLNLTIRNPSSTRHNSLSTRQQWCSNIELFAPGLCIFEVSCISSQKVFGTHLSSIKQVSIHVYDDTVSNTLLNWLIEMTNIESLTVTPRALQALSLFPDDIFNLKLTSWGNLKSLKLNLTFGPYPLYKKNMPGLIKLEPASGKSWKENAKLRETAKAMLNRRHSSILDGMIEFLLQNSPSAKVDILWEFN